MSGATRSALGTIGRGLRELLSVRWVRVLAVLALVGVVVRFGGVWLLGRTVRTLARDVGIECEWEDLNLSMLDGRGEVRFLSLTPTGEGGEGGEGGEAGEAAAREGDAEALVAVEYAVFDLDVRALFSGRLSVHRAEVDGLDVQLERSAEGTWNVERHIELAQALSILQASEEPAPEPEETTADESDELRIAPPLAVAAMRMQHARLRILDHAVSPPFDETLEANLRLSNLGAKDRRVRVSATMTGGEVLDGATLDGVATWEEDSLALDLRAHAGSFRAGPLAPYLAQVWVEPRAESIEVECDLSIELAVVGEARDALRGTVLVQDMGLAADGRSELRLDAARIELERASKERTTLPRIALEGVRGGAKLDADGSLELGGFALLARPSATPPPAPGGASSGGADLLAQWAALWDPERYPSWAALFARADPEAYPWSLGELSVTDVALELVDRSFDEPAELQLVVDAFALGPIVHDPALERAPIPLQATLRAPGLAESIRVGGTLAPFAPKRGCDLTLEVDGIGLEAAGPYLRRSGLEDTLEDGTLRARLMAEATTDERGRTEGWIELEELALTGTEELFGVRSMAARELVIDPEEGLVRLGDVEIAGPRLFLARGPSSGLLALGLRVGRAAAAAPDANAVPAPARGEAGEAPAAGGSASEAGADAPDASGLPIPRLELGRLAWTGTDITFVDQAVDPPGRVELDELGFELTGLTIGGDPEGPEPEPARFTARLVARDLAEQLALSGTIRSKPGPIDLSAELSAEGAGLRGALVAPYLRELGLEPALTEGRFAATLEARLREDDGAWRAALAARDVVLEDGGTPWLSVAELAVEELAFEDGELSVGRVALVEPYARLAREEDGVLRAAGLRLLGPPPAPPVPPEDQTASEPAGPAPLALPELPPARVGTLEVRGARFAWSDAVPSGVAAAAAAASDDDGGDGDGDGEREAPAGAPLELELGAAFELRELDLSGASPASFQASVTVPGVLGALTVDGNVHLAQQGWRVEAGVEGSGLVVDGALPYLPPSVRPSPEPSSFRGRFAARVAPHTDGGLSATLESSDVELRTGDELQFAARRASASIARFDPLEQRVTIEAVETEGVELAVRRDADGVLYALGLALDPAAEAEVAPEPAEEPSSEGSSPPARRAPPRVEITAGIDVGVERLVVRDASLGADAKPLELRGALRIPGPCVLIDADPRELPPVTVELEAAVAELFEGVAELRAAPFADPPTFALELGAEGVRPQGLVEIVPALAELASGETEEGVARASLTLELDVRRSAPYDLGLGRAFGLDLHVADVGYFERSGGRAYAGVDEVRVEGRVDPARGLVQLKTIDVQRPHGFVRRDADGVHAFGLVVTPPAAAEELETSEVDEREDLEPVQVVEAAGPEASRAREAASPASPGSPGDEAPAPEAPTGELRIDELLVSGIDFELVDATGEPPLRVPLSDLDAELKRFTTRAFTEPRPISFSAFLTAGSPEPDAPPVFGEVALAGRMALAPEPKGYAQVSVEGLELVPFAGLAATQNLTIGNGALDASVRVRVKDATSGKVNASMTFSDLELAEPDGGPIQNLLSLPASLDAVLFLLRNQNGEHRFSLGFPVTEDGLSVSSLAVAAAGATAEVIARAVAGAPLRLVGGLIPGSGGDEEKPEESWTLTFGPGGLESQLDAAARQVAFDAIAQRLNARGGLVASLRHELAEADLERAAQLANPSADECRELARGLRQRKAELQHAVDELATEARTRFAIGREEEALAAADELRALERRLLATEEGLDQVLGILRRDSERQRDKRTRAACRELAAERLERVKGELGTWISRRAEERLDVRSPRPRVVEGLAESRIVIELREK